jgi:hypothetical protein
MTRRTGAMARSAKSILPARLPLRLSHRPMPATGAVSTGMIPVRLAARLPHRELGFLPLRSLAFRPRQRGADQPAMHRAVVLTASIVVGALLVASVGGGSSLDRHEVRIGRGGGPRNDSIEIVGGVVNVLGSLHRGNRARARVVENFLRQSTALLAARRRGLALLVFVLGVARRTPRLPDVVLNHRDDDMVGDAALARAVIVQNVTEPKPALLHELPRNGSFRLGMETGAGG